MRGGLGRAGVGARRARAAAARWGVRRPAAASVGGQRRRWRPELAALRQTGRWSLSAAAGAEPRSGPPPASVRSGTARSGLPRRPSASSRRRAGLRFGAARPPAGARPCLPGGVPAAGPAAAGGRGTLARQRGRGRPSACVCPGPGAHLGGRYEVANKGRVPVSSGPVSGLGLRVFREAGIAGVLSRGKRDRC